MTNIRKDADNWSTITIEKAREMDEGYYQCFAKDAYGTALSDVIDVRMAFITSTKETLPIVQITAVEGMPFHIQANRQRGFPESDNGWCTTTDIISECERLSPSGRMQIADNGNS